jgi:hypothetical protein
MATAAGCTTVDFMGVDLRAPEAAGTAGGAQKPTTAGPSSTATPQATRSQATSSLTPGQARLLAPQLPANPLAPSNDRDWSPDQAVLSSAEYSADGKTVTIRNVRHCDYRTEADYDVHHEDRTYDLSKLKSIDFIRVPFPEAPDLAHTMLSFGFDDRDYLAVSVEIRKEKGETYNPLLASFNKYEIMYVLADERDVIGVRANYRLNDVYVYPTRAKPEEVRAMFDDVMARVNQLLNEPEFYHTITNNCTTNIVRHVNRLAPNRIKYDYRVLLPGYSDRLAYELGLLDTDVSFEETRRRARVTDLAYRFRDSPDFSRQIRSRSFAAKAEQAAVR